MDYQLRLMREADLPAVDRLLRRAYRNENDYTARLRRHLEVQPDGWLVAEYDGALAGVGGATIMGAVSYIGLVGVDPDLQGRGIATVLMRALIAWLQDHGCSTILLDASDAGKPLYLRLGFVIEDSVSIWRAQERAPLPDQLPATVVVQPFRESDLSAIIAFDAQGYSAPRDRIIAAFIAGSPALVSIARDQAGALLGYLLVQEESQAVGPWLAARPEAARALLENTLARHGALIQGVIAPDANRNATDILHSLGFLSTRTLAHMRLGAPLPPSRRQAVYGQISLALG